MRTVMMRNMRRKMLPSVVVFRHFQGLVIGVGMCVFGLKGLGLGAFYKRVGLRREVAMGRLGLIFWTQQTNQ